MSRQVAVASTSQLAADGGASVIERGGNAVDAALAAALVSINSEPGVCSLGCGGYVTVWAPGMDPVTIDGCVTTPGRGLPETALGGGGLQISMAYGGGVTTVIGPGSVAVPGGVAALGLAAERYGALDFAAAVAPSVAIAEAGFPLSQASYNYLIHSGDMIFGQDPDGWAALHDADGQLLKPGDRVIIPHLAETLARLGEAGVHDFYHGALAARMAHHVQAGGGMLTTADLASYEPLIRKSLVSQVGPWQVATNPPPAIGGGVLTAMLTALTQGEAFSWQPDGVARLIHTQHQVLEFRRSTLDESNQLADDVQALLNLAYSGAFSGLEAPSTVHTSAADDEGLACAVTMSAGYGSGVMPSGTGVWMNNCLGELELNKKGLVAGPPGTRLPSNMAPTAARRSDGAVLAIGSPGADRITTALTQVLLNLMVLEMSLEEAISQPRLHVEHADGQWQVALEPGIELTADALPSRLFSELSMFFGGVSAVMHAPGEPLRAAADPRRTGGVFISGC
jgi:gamma-glutamyltranspeptidase/glutathione hydrolase